jgi:hypothetical protein
MPLPVNAACSNCRLRRERIADLENFNADQPVTFRAVLLEQSMGLDRYENERGHYKKCIW